MFSCMHVSSSCNDPAHQRTLAHLHVLNPEDAQVAVEGRGSGVLERQ